VGVPATTVTGATDARSGDDRRLLVQRIAASRVFGKSARLRHLLVYLCDRVLEGHLEPIHEQEVGHHVFGRPEAYDTTADNIVRVHASLLRKRLAEYFSTEGALEPIVIEIPKGNYAPVFRGREGEPPGAHAPGGNVAAGLPEDRGFAWSVWLLGAAVVVFAAATAFLLIKPRQAQRAADEQAAHPIVHLFWSQVIRPDRPTDIVLDDASVGLYQDLTKRRVPLNDYYDRSYLRKLPESADADVLNRSAAASVLIRRYASYAAVAPLWKLFQVFETERGQPSVQFARDYSFHALKTNNTILLGGSQSNPWVEPFEDRLGLRWEFDRDLESAYPIDVWANESERSRFHPVAQAGEIREGYCAISLLSNLGATGNALLISATGGSTMAACSEFLTNEQAVSALHQRLPGSSDTLFPPFEALLRIKGRSTQPRDISVVLSRPPRK